MLVAIQQAAPILAAAGKDDRCFVIVGAGAAGVVAAQTLRRSGFAGKVVLIGEEAELPYDRTVLSKYTLAGTEGGEKSPLQNADFYAVNRIKRMVGTVSKIDPLSQRIDLVNGEFLSYDKAMIATGGRPKRLNVEGESLKGVFVLRSGADAAAIAEAAAQAESAVIVGSGFIAMEAAASLRQRGLSITVVAPQHAPFERQLGAKVGAVFQRMLEGEGVIFHLGQEITAIEGQHHVERVLLRDGTTLQADLVVVGMGIQPSTNFLPDISRREDGGLNVDSRLRVADEIYAGGDIAAFPLRGDGERVRVEHWRVAQQHGRVAALNMLGIDTKFEAVPYFWTTYFTKRLDYVGHAEKWDEIVIDGDVDKPDFRAAYLQDGKVIAVAGLGRDKQMVAALNLFERQKTISIEALRACMDAAGNQA